MYKPTWQIYFNNSIAFVIYLTLRLFFGRREKKTNRLLFVNTGQIGDLIVSSVIFTNQEKLTVGREVFLLVRDTYLELYKDYQGPVKIIPWNYNQYKYNPVYRISFLRKLHAKGFETCINVTAARGITNDELSLLSGAQHVYCLNNNWKYLTKLFGEQMDKQYDEIFSFGTINEPQRNVLILEHLTGERINVETVVAVSSTTEHNALSKLKKYVQLNDSKKIITMAPISDGELRNWPLEYFSELCRSAIAKCDVQILLLGTKLQRQKIDSISKLDPENIWNLAGELSLLESASVVKKSDLFIGNDSGFTHIAKALKKNLIGIIGGGCYGMFFPYNTSDRERLLFHQLDCFGCEWRCHLDRPYCVQNVTVEQVTKEVEHYLH